MANDGLLAEIRQRLAPHSDSASLDAQVLLAHVLGVSRAWVLAHPEIVLTPIQQQHLTTGLERLEAGEPLPYVLGHWEFFGLDFIVSPDVLIPRPETELLVETALGWLARRAARRAWQVADVGTGSGCIAVSLAVHAPRLQVVACDISLPALAVAQRNVRAHAVEGQVSLAQCDLLTPFSRSTPFDLICANLPYIPAPALQSLAVARREPLLALDGGPDGLSVVHDLLDTVDERLASDGLLLLEIEATSSEAALRLVRAAFPRGHVELCQDLGGLDRLVVIDLSTS
jgi:release factor glutamine methyltransferase